MPDRQSIAQFKIRLHRDVIAHLKKAAKAEDRSANDEAARRLEKSFRGDDIAAIKRSINTIKTELTNLSSACYSAAHIRYSFTNNKFNVTFGDYKTDISFGDAISAAEKEASRLTDLQRIEDGIIGIDEITAKLSKLRQVLEGRRTIQRTSEILAT